MKKYILSIALLLVFAQLALAQAIDKSKTTTVAPPDSLNRLPEFPGGLSRYIAENMHYPQAAFDKKIEGTVLVDALIGATGSVLHVSVTKSVSPELDSEAVRVVRSMPKWKPGLDNGKAAAYHMEMELVFSVPSKVKAVNQNKDKTQLPQATIDYNKFLKENIRVPANSPGGTVILEVIIEEDGSPGKVNIKQSVSASLDAEATRLVKSLPRFKPGTYDGKPVPSMLILKITFPKK